MERLWVEKNLRALIGQQVRERSGGDRRKKVARTIEFHLNVTDLVSMVLQWWVIFTEKKRNQKSDIQDR